MEQLLKKLNYKSHEHVLILNLPNDGLQQWKSEFPNAVFTFEEVKLPIDFVIVFCQNEIDVEASARLLVPNLAEDAPLWFCYAKGSSKKYKSTINRDRGWNSLGQYNYEPVRQVAIDDDWSALRFRPVKFIKTMTRNEQMVLSEEAKKRLEKP